MCLTSDAVYRIRDADAIVRIQRKDDQKIAKNSKLFYTKYRPLSRRLDRCDRVIQDESGDSNGGNV